MDSFRETSSGTVKTCNTQSHSFKPLDNSRESEIKGL